MILTCYNQTSNEVQFSIDIKSYNRFSGCINISWRNSKSFTLTNSDTIVPNLRPYKGASGSTVKLPGKNEGKTCVCRAL